MSSYLYPYSMLSPHPPQIHSLLRLLGRLAREQPHDDSWPSRHAREMEWTTPAAAMEWANAASRLPAIANNSLGSIRVTTPWHVIPIHKSSWRESQRIPENPGESRRMSVECRFISLKKRGGGRGLCRNELKRISVFEKGNNHQQVVCKWSRPSRSNLSISDATNYTHAWPADMRRPNSYHFNIHFQIHVNDNKAKQKRDRQTERRSERKKEENKTIKLLSIQLLTKISRDSSDVCFFEIRDNYF